MELRGYDDYEVTLGDEIRGERASRGKSLADVERELRIKADLILAIEDCDLAAFPNRSVVAGYVRSYARYLGMNPDEFYRRFCADSGFVPPHSSFGSGALSGAARGPAQARILAASPFDQSRFAVPPAQSRFSARVPLGSVVSGLALVGLVAGLGYGGYALLQNMQRVGFAPLPQAPDVVAEPPRILAPSYAAAGQPPGPEAYSENGALAAVFAPDDRPPLQRRDGPISAIDPVEAGVFADAAPPVEPRFAEAEPDIASADAGSDQAGALAGGADRRAAAVLASAEIGGPVPAALRGIAVHAVDSAWIRVHDESRAVIFEGILPPGERFQLPERVSGAQLRAGNAGAVFIVVDGVSHGPIGRPGSVVKNLALEPVGIRERYPRSDSAPMAANPAETAERQAAAGRPGE